MSEPKFNYHMMVARWGSPYVAREKVGEFSGGILHPRTLANLDSKGLGPKGRIRVGRKVAYDVVELCRWLAARTEDVK
ncbi:MAG: hypothetical protein ACLQBD_17040 [Syntrophobacteraceae bacterium]